MLSRDLRETRARICKSGYSVISHRLWMHKHVLLQPSKASFCPGFWHLSSLFFSSLSMFLHPGDWSDPAWCDECSGSRRIQQGAALQGLRWPPWLSDIENLSPANVSLFSAAHRFVFFSSCWGNCLSSPEVDNSSEVIRVCVHLCTPVDVHMSGC